MTAMQMRSLVEEEAGLVPAGPVVPPFRRQLLKWIGNKQRLAHEIVAQFPREFGTYYEPFLGSGAVLGTLAPARAVGSDIGGPLMEIWQTLHRDPDLLTRLYAVRWQAVARGNKVDEYERIKASYNAQPNGADLLFLCRSCYGAVLRFRQRDGYMSTPCGVHKPMPPHMFSRHVNEWHRRTRGTEFRHVDYEEAMDMAGSGDMVYCDPPYTHTQSILYKAQSFDLTRLLRVMARCKERGVYVALSIDGTKKSGRTVCDLSMPDGLFETEVFVNCGRSMLRRFQMGGNTLESEIVADRLLLTY